MPTWVDGPDGTPYRPRGTVWVSIETGLVNVALAEPGADTAALALDTLIGLGLKFARTRPSAIQVADADLGDRIAQALADPEMGVSVVPRLDAVREVVARMAADMAEVRHPPALDERGVTVERMRAFAAAARDFYAAAPWRFLSDEDLIQVETPKVGRAFRYLTVLGRAGESFGLGFFTSEKDFDQLLATPDPEQLLARRDRWSVFFGEAWETPFSDLDLWEEHGFPLAAPRAYPMVARFGAQGLLGRADARQLADIEAILLALSRVTEAEIDQGRWSLEVVTHDGPRQVTLAIPDLLRPLEVETPRSTAQLGLAGVVESAGAPTPEARAQDLAYEAMDERGRRRILLARKALEVSPDCADAYIVLAEDSPDPEAARALYVQAVAAGERTLGPAIFASEAPPFWHDERTRPYVRARFGLARCLEDGGRRGEAIWHYQELLRLNPDDNMGARYPLLNALLLAGRNTEAGALLHQYGEEASALWLSGHALWAFRREGDSLTARQWLRAALRANRHLGAYLTGETEPPDFTPSSYALGSREEAIVVDDELGEAWEATPGALDWLAARDPSSKRGKRRGR